MNINAINVTSRQDFIYFLHQLLQDLQEHPEEWANPDLPDFLEALSLYAEDVQQYYHNTGQDMNADQASWSVFADIIKGAHTYE